MGCSKNLVDSESLLGQLQLNKADLTDSVDDADTVVINTCGFIESVPSWRPWNARGGVSCGKLSSWDASRSVSRAN
jgi:hypothetical protein